MAQKQLDLFKDQMAKQCFGKTKSECDEGICINCGEEALPKCYSAAGLREFKISGLCERCFDAITGPY